MQTTNPVFGLTTLRVLRVLRHAAAPAAGAVYLVLWIVAESGRWPLGPNILMFSLYAIAIGLAARLPRIALGLVLVVGLCQALGLLQPPDSTTWPSSAAAAYAVLLVAAFAPLRVRWLALPTVVVSGLLFAFAAAVPTARWPYKWGSWTDSGQSPREDALTLALAAISLGVIAWAIGFGISWVIARVRTDVEWSGSELERVDVELRLSEDRARISRDVHDSLAHSLAVIVSQAQGAAALSPRRPEVATEALGTVTEVARAALVDVRNLVERIQGEGDVTLPRLGVDDIPELVDQMRQVGMRIDLQESGASDGVALTSAQEVAVYRIVQESLTNALKHAGSSARVVVVLDRTENGLGLEVLSEGEAALVEPSPTGIGIAGMKERARLSGGWLRAGPAAPADESGTLRFAVTAFVPTVRSLARGHQNA